MTRTSILSSIVVALSLLSIKPVLYAQTFSYDGNRWYEIEVSIFTNQNLTGNNPELFMPEDVDLSYPAAIRELLPLEDFFSIDFNEEEPAVFENEAFVEAEEITIGPLYREANREFRMADKVRDAFIALPQAEHEFTRYNRNIELSPEHRILYHAVWRQPVLNKIQSTAIFIRGGDNFGQHSELEGSLMLSYNINRVDVDARLWRNSFNIDSFNFNSFNLNSAARWEVPDLPFSSGDEEEMRGLVIDRVYPMQQTRQMISNELHYLDHPAFGMLIEVRPYELPAIFDFSLD